MMKKEIFNNVCNNIIKYLVSLLPSRRNLEHIVKIFRRVSFILALDNKHSTPMTFIIL